MSETKGQQSEQSAQDEVPPSPLALEIKFIPDRWKEGTGAKADVPPPELEPSLPPANRAGSFLWQRAKEASSCWQQVYD
jgi:hypothetical protein